ncbi:MAG: hypothetical protein WDZ59_10765 [Pirellulales bacterium]
MSNLVPVSPQDRGDKFVIYNKPFPYERGNGESRRQANLAAAQYSREVFDVLTHKAQSVGYELRVRDVLFGSFEPPDERPYGQRVRDDANVQTNSPKDSGQSNWAKDHMATIDGDNSLTASQKKRRKLMYREKAKVIDAENAAKQEQAERESDPIYALTKSEAESLPSYFQPSWEATAAETHEAHRLSEGFLSGKLSVEEFEAGQKTLLDSYFGRREAEKSEAAEKLKQEQAELAAERKALKMEREEITDSTAPVEAEPQPESNEPAGLAELAKLPPDVLAGLAKLPADALAALAKQETGQAE